MSQTPLTPDDTQIEMTPKEWAALAEDMRIFEREYGISIYAIRAYGSHATGLSNESSDYDLGLLFDQPAIRYKLGTDTESFQEHGDQRSFDTTHDYSAWSTRAFCEALRSNDPNAIELLQSEQTAHSAHPAREPLAELEAYIDDSHNGMSLHERALSLASSNFKRYLDSDLHEQPWKKASIILYNLLRAAHLRSDETAGLPPINASELGNACYDEYKELTDAARYAFGEKRARPSNRIEWDMQSHWIEDTIETTINEFDATDKGALAASLQTETPDWDELRSFIEQIDGLAE